MKKLLLIGAFALFVLPFTAMAEATTDSLDVYISATDPGNIALGEAPWVGPFEYGAPITDTIADVDPGETVWIGIPNEVRWVNMKYLTIRLYGAVGLDVDSIAGFAAGSAYGIGRLVAAADSGDYLKVTIEIFPQPEWEWVMFTNNTDAVIVIGIIQAESGCELVPSMTYYGLGILALLLIGSTVWILRRRRVGSVA